MANPEHVAILKRGVPTWNEWREQDRGVKPDLSDLNAVNPNELPWLSGNGITPNDGFGPQLIQDPRHGPIVAIVTGGPGMDLSEVNFDETNLSRAHLNRRCLQGATFVDANLTDAMFRKADLSKAALGGTIAIRGKLEGATLKGADLSAADFSETDLTGADLSYATLAQTKFRKATITGCRVYGASVWEVDLEGAVQGELIIQQRHGDILYSSCQEGK